MNLIKKLPGIRKLFQKVDYLKKKIKYLENEIVYLQCETNRQKHILKYKNGQKINIVFVCHRPQVWNSLKSLCDCCIKDSDFNVFIVAIPIKKQLPHICFDHEIYESEGAEDFWKDYPCTVIKGYNYDSGEWFDLRTLKPDYVLFQQPYNIAKCELYKSWNVAEYASICYTSYYYTTSHIDVLDCMPTDFIRNVSLCFLQNTSEVEWFNQKFNSIEYPNIKRFLSGSPRFDNLEKYHSVESPLWKLKKEDGFRVVWTPRWTTNENTCHFFDYKDKFVSYCNQHADMDFVFRPHPQAKLNYAAEEGFSIADFEKYESLYLKSNNMNIDNTSDFLPLFYSADVLISDYSSVIPEFFLTGKPIIYCKKDKAIVDLEGIWTEGLYYARSWNELETLLERLRNGDDPLFNKRKELIGSEFAISSEGAGMTMKNLIKADFRGE